MLKTARRGLVFRTNEGSAVKKREMSGRLGQSGNQHSAEIKRTADSEVATIQSISLESSFPPVAWLRECNELHPGFAKRYLDDLIDERQAITAVEIEHVRHSHTIQSRGQIYGLVIGLAGICAWCCLECTPGFNK